MSDVMSSVGETNFLSIRATELLPASLRRDLPEILWLPPGGWRPSSGGGGRTVLLGTPLSSADSTPVALASISDAGEARLHFDVEAAVEGILLERYHSGLEPTLEMRLPFNYSRVPSWLKQLALAFRSDALYSTPHCNFPPGDPSFIVEWLRALARWAGCPAGRRTLRCGWPDKRRAAVAITHDVDTGWIFEHPEWIERFVDLEEAHGFHGAWYCVPSYASTKAAERAMEGLLARGCEIGCHGYNHDAKWALMEGPAFERRLAVVRAFAQRWQIRGFRSEWLWRSKQFLEAIAELFDYDSSVPNAYSGFTRFTRNGCGTCIPYRTHGDLVELPLTLPMDEERRREGLDVQKFWLRQIDRAEAIIERGGMVVLTLHPQPHQAANEESLAALEAALHWLGSQSDLWIARPDEIVDWVAGSHREEVV